MKKLLVLLFLSSYLLACSKTVESNIESNQAIDFATQTLNRKKEPSKKNANSIRKCNLKYTAKGKLKLL